MKKIVLLLCLLISFTCYSQTNPAPCTDLFFSEYIEGTSNNKALEIYNPTSSTVDLADYSIKIYFNGSLSPNTYPLIGMLAAGQTFTFGNSSAALPQILAADTLMGLGSPVSFNGDDAIELLHDTLVIDVFGIVGNDPGTNWPVGTGATSEFTLVRKPTVHNGYLIWTGSCDTTWNVHPQNTVSFFGSHSKDVCPTGPVVANFSFTGTCAGETTQMTNLTTGGDGTFTYTWSVDGIPSSTSTNPSFVLAPGCYIIQLIATDGMLNDDTSIQTVCVVPLDNPMITTTDSILCNDSFGMFLYSDDTTGGMWSGTFVSDMGSGSGFFSSAAIAPGTYAAVYTTAGVCPNSDSVLIHVPVPPVADYSYTNAGMLFTFTNLSTNANSYFWTFDSFATSTATDTSVNFPSTGSFNVCLEASNDSGCVSLHCETIIITGIESNSITQLQIFPNPANEFIRISGVINSTNALLVDATGKKINLNVNNGMINLTTIAPGAYYLIIGDQKQKLLIVR